MERLRVQPNTARFDFAGRRTTRRCARRIRRGPSGSPGGVALGKPEPAAGSHSEREVVPTVTLKMLMLSRRQMIRNTSLGLAGLLMGPRQLLAGGHEPSGTSPMLTPFVDALRIPPVLTPVMRGKTQHYTLTMKAG